MFNYTFENMARIGNDNTCIDQKTLQNVGYSNYMLQNYFASDCTMKNPIDLATTQPGVFYRGGYNSGSGGCNIDDSSNLQIGSIQTQPKCRIDLFQRPFATIPYLGRGTVNPVVESQMLQGEFGSNRRTSTDITEKSYLSYYQTPLLNDVKDRMTNPSYSVEGVASKGWIRGGVPSRELTRDNEYFQK